MRHARVPLERLTALLVLAFAACGASWAQTTTLRLQSAEGNGAAQCFEQLRKAPPPKLETGNVVLGAVERWNPSDPSAVLVRMTFSGPGAPTSSEVLLAEGDPRLRKAAEEAVQGYRLSCLQGGQKIVALQRFMVLGTDSPMQRLKPDLSLVELLNVRKDIKTVKARFDFNAMACPFKLEFAPYQPYAANAVVELDSKNASRSEFIRWLQDAPIDLPPKTMRTAIGETSVVTVPCTVLDLS
jgi:hypothetical protein